LKGPVIQTDNCCPIARTKHKNTTTPISYAPIPILLSRDEYDEIKNDTKVPPPSHPPDEISYSTLVIERYKQ
jgi:hypothetical protein